MLEFLKAHGAAGATITRGIAGFGAHARIHTATLFEITGDLPLVLEWVDTGERVQRLLPELAALLDGGLITTEPVEIVRYRPHVDRQGRSPPAS
jgi:PII-like signaling protein